LPPDGGLPGAGKANQCDHAKNPLVRKWRIRNMAGVGQFDICLAGSKLKNC
jgi:hypothetical protein